MLDYFSKQNNLFSQQRYSVTNANFFPLCSYIWIDVQFSFHNESFVIVLCYSITYQTDGRSIAFLKSLYLPVSRSLSHHNYDYRPIFQESLCWWASGHVVSTTNDHTLSVLWIISRIWSPAHACSTPQSSDPAGHPGPVCCGSTFRYRCGVIVRITVLEKSGNDTKGEIEISKKISILTQGLGHVTPNLGYLVK